MISSYLADIIILLIAAVVLVPLCQMIRLGAVPGFVLAGVLVGPSGLALINNIIDIRNLSEIGVVLLLFVIGIELKPNRLWMMRRLVFGLGTLQVLLAGTILGGLLHLIFKIPLAISILIGPSLALSSTSFVIQLLTERKLLLSNIGRASFAILLMQDLAVIPLLALVPLLSIPKLNFAQPITMALFESIFILTVVIIFGRYFLRPILHRVALTANPEVFTALAVLIVLGSALITEHIGLSMAMGAFLAGLLISDSAYRHQVVGEIQPFRGLFLGLFFMSMGMWLDLGHLLSHPFVTLGWLLALLILKTAILWPIAYLFGFGSKNSLAIAILLAQSGEFALVLFALANDDGLLSDTLFQQLLLIVLLSMLITPLLLKLAQMLGKHGTKPVESTTNYPSVPVVIAGFGRVGKRIGEVLKIANQSFVALDVDASVVEEKGNMGLPVFYGDVRQAEVLKAAGAIDARILIITLNDHKATEQIVSGIRQTHPNIKIFARAHNINECQDLQKQGVFAISEYLEASLELARLTLVELDTNYKEQEEIIAEFRKSYYEQNKPIAEN